MVIILDKSDLSSPGSAVSTPSVTSSTPSSLPDYPDFDSESDVGDPPLLDLPPPSYARSQAEAGQASTSSRPSHRAPQRSAATSSSRAPPAEKQSSSARSSASTIPPTNFVDIKRWSEGINGKWKIDTSIPNPRGRSAWGSAVCTIISTPNLSVKSMAGPVIADVDLVGGRDRAILNLASMADAVNLRITNVTGQKMKISCKSAASSVSVKLPRSFKGFVATKTFAGSCKLSPDVASAASVISEQMGLREYYIDSSGSYPTTSNPRNWQGDELFAESLAGDVYLEFSDELENGDPTANSR